MSIIRMLLATVLLHSMFLHPAPASDAAPAASPLDPFRKMAGAWDADVDGDGKPDMTVEYRVISNGSVVAETVFGGTPQEMITTYYMDGPRLLCTHFCAAGNQPRLEATKITDTTTVFTMLDATNLPDRNAMHMNGVTFTFTDPNHVTTQWTGSENGKTSPHAAFKMTRRTAEDSAAGGSGAADKNSGPAAAKSTKEPAVPQNQSNFVILMYEDDNAWAKLPKERQDELMKQYAAWVGDLKSKGIFKSGSPCGSRQVLLRGDGGQVMAEPYAPSKDVLTGFFVISAASMDEAVALARTCPSLTHGERIVVRPAAHE